MDIIVLEINEVDGRISWWHWADMHIRLCSINQSIKSYNSLFSWQSATEHSVENICVYIKITRSSSLDQG